MVAQHGPLARHAWHQRLAAAGEPCEEVRLDEACQHLHVALGNLPVQPDIVPALRRAQADLRGRVERVVLHDPVLIHQPADHPPELRVGVEAVRAQRIEERDVCAREVL